MRFTFDEDQREYQRVLRDYLAQHCPTTELRALWDDERGRSPQRWAQLAELGAIGLAAPTALGGMGLDDVALLLPLEEAGRAALPEPLGAVAAVAVPLLSELAVGDEWVERAAAGTAMPIVGFGAGPRVADAHVADVLLLGAGSELYAVDPTDVVLTRRLSLDPTRRLFDVAWQPGAGGELLAAGNGVVDALKRAQDRSAVALAAELLGVTAQLLDMAEAYARERQQFGKPIGAFQAIKHLLADALVGLAFARPVVYRAAASLADGAATASRDASMAKAFASDAATAAGKAALQIHGATGYTWEHDLSIWLKRAQALSLASGDARFHRERVARAVLTAA
ncbi:MAG TPA: acyl-CoA dehydrogenase [Conexibacter sp.]|jgi:alkylation response protein AidB-like acyl-CoA dehydrogenase